jgi:hypothetical protein
MKKVLVMGDTHCGSDIGLTHPAYQQRARDPKTVKAGWDWWSRGIAEHGPYDACLLTGDMIDGQQQKDSGTGLITSDLYEQLDMAERVISTVRLNGKKRGFKIAAVTGTCYHVSIAGTSAERYLAESCGFDLVGDRLIIPVDGLNIDLCHKTGKSGIPHGSLSAPQKEALWNVVHAQHGTQDATRCLLRGHTHEMSQSYTPEAGWVFKVPALQMSGGKYGRQQCRGYCHFGFLVLHIDKGEIVQWHAPHMKVTPQDLRMSDFM